MTQNPPISPDGTSAAPGLADLTGHPLACAVLRLVRDDGCGVDAAFEHEDGLIHTLDARITVDGRRMSVIQREDSLRAMVDNPYPHSAAPALCGRRIGDVVDLPAASGASWRDAVITAAEIVDEDGYDVLTMRIADAAPERVGDHPDANDRN